MVFCFARLRFSEREKLRRTQPAKADKIERLTAEVSQTDIEIKNVSKLIAVTKKYTRIDELTPEILNAFLDKIVVHKREKKDGKRTQAVDIYYSYVGIVDIPQTRKCGKWNENICGVLIISKSPEYRQRQEKSVLLPIHIFFIPIWFNPWTIYNKVFSNRITQLAIPFRHDR